MESMINAENATGSSESVKTPSLSEATAKDIESLLGKDYLGKTTPKLGFGLMRLPKNDDGSIDVAQTSQMVDEFLGAGFTYFDTAFAYEGSEEAIRKALVERHPRSSFTLATKLFAVLAHSPEEARSQFETSLERTGAGYFDFYLLHNLGQERTALYDDWGLWDFAREQREKGLIRHLGFSMHATAEELDAVLTSHPEAEFVQLQINYADWEDPVNQSRRVWECALSHGKPVVIMEPVKGGLLANPPEPVARVLRSADPAASYASWALRFSASLPGVVTVLSGMSSLEQMRDNIATFSNFHPLGEQGLATIEAARQAMASIEQVPCTSCHYCTKGCPQGIPIPGIFSALNTLLIYGDKDRAQHSYEWETGQANAKASDCIGCGQCEGVCPQRLPIIDLLSKASSELER
jgi:predicted aldo/keto reductase-like oxidoreductase